MAPDAVGYVAAHGTATKLNDVTETRAMRAIFGPHADRLAVSSAKGAVGHMVGAAGAMGLFYALQALHSQAVPATANLHQPDPECDLDFVPLEGRPARLGAALCNAFGFGGPSASVLLRTVS
jgi:3-oxoacyl-(acyl-carrier-protein) synthase